jgi:hypothetical protein
MYMTALAFGAWLQQHHKVVILTTAISTLIGWPFAALLGFVFKLKSQFTILIDLREFFFSLKTSDCY